MVRLPIFRRRRTTSPTSAPLASREAGSNLVTSCNLAFAERFVIDWFRYNPEGIKQQFTQGNIAASLNALDLAISGQGFFALKPSLTSAQTVYTRNGSLNVNNDRYVVDSAGQYLLTYPVNTDGSVTAKDLDSAVPLQLPVTSGDPQATSNIKLGVNVNAGSDVVTDRPQFQTDTISTQRPRNIHEFNINHHLR